MANLTLQSPPAPAEPGTVHLFGLNIRAASLSQAADLLAAHIARRDLGAGVVVTPNVDHIVRLERNAGFKEQYGRSHFIFADGMPVVWASRMLGKALPERVTGSDLFVELCRRAATQRWRVAVLGGMPGSEAQLTRLFETCYPGILVNVICPSMRFEPAGPEGEAAASAIAQYQPDVVFVCLGMPKQELWTFQHASTLGGGVVLCVGAAMDFGLGLQRRAPAAVQRVGMEWLWRLGSNPRRFWRRYLIDDPRFAALCWREWRGQRKGLQA